MLPVKAIAMAVQSEKLIFTVLSAAGQHDIGKIYTWRSYGYWAISKTPMFGVVSEKQMSSGTIGQI